jgi:hypothetical protein
VWPFGVAIRWDERVYCKESAILPSVDKKLAEIIDRLEILRATAKQPGKHCRQLTADFNAAVEQLNQAATQLTESKAIAKEMCLRDKSSA